MRALCILTCLLFSTPASAGEAPQVRRFALVAAANDGGADRTLLRYAESDALSFSRVLLELGGVGEAERVLLVNPTRETFEDGFEVMRNKLQVAKMEPGRIELLFYYSGHSDEDGLLLGTARVTYKELRQAIASLPADVRIGILDSCSSGAMTRRKGGRKRPPFLVDESTQVSGYAYLTSSSENEAAQESDRIKASFFTHYLVSGMRGAADVTDDGQVTLNEAYQFAFRETLARTERTQAGAQHPAYDIQLVGTGDLVLTDLRGTSAGLVMGEEIRGRIYVRDGDGELVAELNKPAGRKVELGLEPGAYHVLLDQKGNLFAGEVTLSDGVRTSFDESLLHPVDSEATVARGTEAATLVETEEEVEYTHVPFNLSFVPVVSIGGDGDRVISYLSISMLMAKYAKLHGLEIGAALAWADEEVLGLQITGIGNYSGGDVIGAQATGIGNYAGGVMKGMQASGIGNYAGGSVRGLQASGIGNYAGANSLAFQVTGIGNAALGDFGGMQGSGVFNVAHGDLKGVQATGIANWASGYLTGAQVSSIANYAPRVTGLQATAIANVAQEITGAQFGIVNIGGSMTGAQIGMVNISTGPTKGLQLGLVNYADEMEGAPIGLLSVVRKNGVFKPTIYTSDTGLFNAGLKMGAKSFYGILAVSVAPMTNTDGWAPGIGLGGHIPISEDFFSNIELIYHWVQDSRSGFQNDAPSLEQLRVLLGWQVTDSMAIVGGPTLNVLHTNHGVELKSAMSPGWTWNLGSRTDMWIGGTLGVQFF